MEALDWYLEHARAPELFGLRTWPEPLTKGQIGRTVELVIFHRVLLVSWIIGELA